MKVDAIFTADWHLMEKNPICRKDDYTVTQFNKIDQIMALSKKHRAPIFIAGDIFDKWKPSPSLLRKALNHTMGPMVYAIAGNHDLPQHNMSQFDRSGLGVLTAGMSYVTMMDRVHEEGVIKDHVEEGAFAIHPFYFGTLPDEEYMKGLDKSVTNVALIHKFLYAPGDKKVFADVGDSGMRLLKKLKGFDLIVSGDNHQSFVLEHRGRKLVNPGSIGRTTAAQENHVPKVYLWDAATGQIKPHNLRCEQGVISREHLDKRDDRDERITAFVESFDDDLELDINFRKNITAFMKKNKIKKKVRNLVWEHVADE